MAETPIPSLIITLAIPTIISMLITNIYNTADTYFVSRIGTSASGATSIVLSLMCIYQAIGFMCGHGSGSFVARLLGAKEAEQAKVYAATAFYTSIVLSAAVSVLGLIFMDPLMKLMGSTDTILPYARQYAMWIMLAGPLLSSSCVLNNILRYEGKAFYAMIGLTAGGIINMIGDPILMFGCHLGVFGAGLSTAISQLISFMILMYMFTSGKTICSFHPRFATTDLTIITACLSVGFPSLIRQGLNAIANILLNTQAGLYGDACIAAMGIVGKMAILVAAVAIGMGQGMQPVASFNYGAKKYNRVRQAFRFSYIAGTLMMAGFAIAVGLFPRQIVTWFRNDPEVIAIGSAALRWQAISCMTQPAGICTNMLFQSIGKSKIASVLASLRTGIYYIPLILILPLLMGVTGIEISQPIADVATALTAFPLAIRFLRSLPTEERV